MQIKLQFRQRSNEHKIDTNKINGKYRSIYRYKTECERNQTETKIFVREVGVLETKGAQILLFMESQFNRSTQQSEKVNQNVHVWILL